MNIFKTVTFTWYQLSALKWSAFLIGLAAGAIWPERLVAFAPHLVIISLILTVYVFGAWWRQIKL